MTGSSINYSIYILWSNASIPIIATHLTTAIKNFDDISCVDLDFWFFNSNYTYVVEFYHLGDIVVGLSPATSTIYKY